MSDGDDRRTARIGDDAGRRRQGPRSAVGAAGHNGRVIHVSEAEFESLVDDALDGIPEGIFATLDNVAVLIEDRPPEGMPDLLGLYEGVPLTERDASWMGSLPDHIRIFREPLLRMCESRQQLVHEVRVTVIHEIAHHFGIDDDRLHRLGWG